ncbi:MAG: tetratricopeptide repeat protein [Nitrospirota bacterium]
MSHRAILWSVILFAVTLAGCQQNTSSAPSPAVPPQAAAPAPPPQQPAPPAAADRSLAFIRLDPANFSMEAIQANKKRVEADPADAVALTQLGHANYMIQRVPTANEYYGRAVRADGKLVEARLGLSNTYAMMGQLDDAMRELDQLLALDRTHPEALYNRGLLLWYGKQDREGARRAWEQLVSSHPTSELARYASAQLAQL